MKWFLQRLAEPSSLAGLSGLFSSVAGMLYGGIPLSAGIPAAIGSALAFAVKEAGASHE